MSPCGEERRALLGYHDDFTATPDAAEAFERFHTLEPWDDRPTLADVVDPDGWFPGKAGQ